MAMSTMNTTLRTLGVHVYHTSSDIEATTEPGNRQPATWMSGAIFCYSRLATGHVAFAELRFLQCGAEFTVEIVRTANPSACRPPAQKGRRLIRQGRLTQRSPHVEAARLTRFPPRHGDRHGPGSVFRDSAGSVLLADHDRFSVSESDSYLQGLEKLRSSRRARLAVGCLSVTARVEPTG